MNNTNEKGFLKTIILIVIALIVLGYFGFDITKIIQTPTVQTNLNATWDFTSKIWNTYLAGPFVYIWDHFVVGVVWQIFKSGMTALGI